MKKYIIALVTLPLCFSFNFSQAQTTEKKVEKEVTVEVDDKTGEMMKTIKVKVKGEDGEEKIMSWSGTNEDEMPTEMKEHMKDVNIAIEVDEDEDIEIEKEIRIEMNKNDSKKKTIEIRTSENGEEKVIIWSGEEGEEMPDDLKEELENVEIIVLDKEGNVEVIEKEIEEGKQIRIKKIRKEGKEKKKIRVKKKSGNDEVQIIEWDGEGEIPADIRETLEKEGIKTKGGNVFIFKSDDENDDNVMIMKGRDHKSKWITEDGKHIEIHEEHDADHKPRLGVMIENHIDGVEVRDVISGSVAEKAGLKKGDVIFQLGKKYIGSTLQLTETLKKSEAGTTLDIMVLRDGKEKKIKAVIE